MELCENCGRSIGRLETPRLFDGHIVCAQCDEQLRAGAAGTIPYASPLTPAPSSVPETPYRALGLETRGAAWAIGLIGFCLSPALIGIPLAIWGVVADSMLRRHYGTADGERALGLIAAAMVLLTFVIFVLYLLYNNRL